MPVSSALLLTLLVLACAAPANAANVRLLLKCSADRQLEGKMGSLDGAYVHLA